jgi:hypothetical protein
MATLNEASTATHISSPIAYVEEWERVTMEEIKANEA